MVRWWQVSHNRRKVPCWVCEAPVPEEYPGCMYGSSLGGAFTFAGCDECKGKRAVTPLHAAWYCHANGIADQAGKDRPDAAKGWSDVDGSGHGIPVHVHLGGRYVPFREWLAGKYSPLPMAAMAGMRAANPGAYLGTVLRL